MLCDVCRFVEYSVLCVICVYCPLLFNRVETEIIPVGISDRLGQVFFTTVFTDHGQFLLAVMEGMVLVACRYTTLLCVD